MGRGRARASLELIEAAVAVVEQCRPITVRGIAYKLFALGLIKSMQDSEYRKVQRLVLEAREEGAIAWEDVVDDGRPTQRPSVFKSPRSFAATVESSWRADPWQEQAVRVEIISEKATVSGVLGPVLRELALPFRAYKGFTSGTAAWTLADDSIAESDDRPLVALYIGDHDPSGRFMSDVDLPGRVERYGGAVELHRIALVEDDLPGLANFDVSTKAGDTRAPWFRKRFGSKCYELDAMDPATLRGRIRGPRRGVHRPWGVGACRDRQPGGNKLPRRGHAGLDHEGHQHFCPGTRMSTAPPVVVSPELRLAHEFLGTIQNPRAPWAEAYTAWAQDHHLSPEMTRAVRVCVLRVRVYGAIERSQRRRRP